jgi:hypothetical protein
MILQATMPLKGYPTWHDLITQFGPYLGTLIFFISIIILLQWFWYNKNIKSKNQEIERNVKEKSELNAMILKLVNQLRSINKK